MMHKFFYNEFQMVKVTFLCYNNGMSLYVKVWPWLSSTFLNGRMLVSSTSFEYLTEQFAVNSNELYVPYYKHPPLEQRSCN